MFEFLPNVLLMINDVVVMGGKGGPKTNHYSSCWPRQITVAAVDQDESL